MFGQQSGGGCSFHTKSRAPCLCTRDCGDPPLGFAYISIKKGGLQVASEEKKKKKRKTMCRADFQSTLHALCMKPCTGSRSEQQAHPRCAAPKVFGRCLLASMSGLINTLLVTNAGRRTRGRAPPGLSVLWVGTAVACGFDTKLCLPKEQADSTSFNFIELKSHC